MSDIDKIIHEMFSENWSGSLSEAPICEMREQLYKNLQNQIDGYWSGSTAYHIMTKGGFLVDSKRMRIEDSGMAKGKQLTALGEMFVADYKASKGEV